MSEHDPIIPPKIVRERLLRAIDSGQLYAPRSYQAERLMSQSRFNIDNWSRQTGKSQVASQDCVHLSHATDESVMCLSASQDLTLELMVKVAIYAEVITGVAGEIQRAVMNRELEEVLYVDEDKIKITQHTITLPNGKRIIGRPANPRTARGFSMHVKLDEFGMHREPDEIWAAAFPSITSRKHLRMDVMSTPGLRSDDKFADLCKAAMRGENDFIYRQVTIHDAIAAGLDADADLLKRQLRDEDRWRREYLCEFVDEAGAFLTYELIRACEHEGLPRNLPFDRPVGEWDENLLGWNPGEGRLYAGVDVGRRHDLTVIWIIQMLGDVAWTRGCIELYKVPFAQQQQTIEAVMDRLPVRRVCIDETGVGMMLAEAVKNRYGSARVECVTFTADVKEELAQPVKSRFEDRLIRIPTTIEIRDDLHSIRKTVTAAGNVRYQGERTSDGHADRFWAMALALHAMDSGAVEVRVRSVDDE